MNQRCSISLVLAALTAAVTVNAADSLQVKTVELPKGKPIVKAFSEWSRDYFGQDGSRLEITRAYFGYQYDWSDNYSSRLVLDVARLGELNSGAFDTTKKVLSTKKETRYESFLKNASLEVKQVIPLTCFELGLVGTRLFAIQEKAWGYRYVAKSMMDEKKYSSSADLGANVQIQVHPTTKLYASVLQGEGFTAQQDLNSNYKTGGGFEFNAPLGVTVFGFGDYMPVDNASGQTTLAGFLGYSLAKKFRIGAEYDFQMNHLGVDKQDLSGLSLYSAVQTVSNLEVFGRIDYATSEGNWNAAADGETYIGGLQYSPFNGIKLALDYQAISPYDSKQVLQHKVALNTEFSY